MSADHTPTGGSSVPSTHALGDAAPPSDSTADGRTLIADPAAGTSSSSSPLGGSRFRIVRFHARGGLGEVFVAEDAELGRPVALKGIRSDRVGDPANRMRFVREAEITGGLEHPGVVPVYSLGSSDDGRPYYAMRLVPGDNLQEALRRFHAAGPPDFGSLEFRRLLGRFVQVCDAIAYAHSRGVLHRDLKPANVLLGPFGETYVADWGLAKPIGQSADPPAGPAAATDPRPLISPSAGDVTDAASGGAMGTPAYMSPEQAAGRHDDLGPATDVYSLGATLYELLTGRTPFAGQSVPLLILEDVSAGRFSPPRAKTPGVPPALEAVCLKAMALRPDDRYPSALALAEDVQQWLADEPVRAYREPWGGRARRWCRRHRSLVTGAVALLVTAVVALAVASFLLDGERRRTDQAYQEAVANEAEARRQQEIATGYHARLRRAAEEFWLTKVHDSALSMTDLDPIALQQFVFGSVPVFYEALLNDASSDARDRAETARANSVIGMIEGFQNRTVQAEAALRRSAEGYRALAAEHPDEPDYRHRLALASFYLGVAYERADGRTADAIAAYRVARDGWRDLLAANENHAAAVGWRHWCGQAAYNVAIRLTDLGPPGMAEAEAAYRESVALRTRLLADDPTAIHHQTDLALSRNNLGFCLQKRNAQREAAVEYRAAVDLRRRVEAVKSFPVNRRELAQSEHNLGLACRQLADPAEAELAFTRARELRVRLVEENPGDATLRNALAWSVVGLANCRLDVGDPAGAAALAGSVAELLSDGDPLYDAACICARAAAGSTSAQERTAARAVDLLRQAIARGYANMAHMLQDDDLASLRQRQDYATLLWDLADASTK
jgi:hypothetical protein